jgi:hypothetical protein
MIFKCSYLHVRDACANFQVESDLRTEEKMKARSLHTEISLLPEEERHGNSGSSTSTHIIKSDRTEKSTTNVGADIWLVRFIS